MIYRILSDSGELIENPDDPEDWDWRPTGTDLAGVAQADADWQDLPSPTVTNPRTRFYFTEAGWHRYGRRVYDTALKAGHQVKVIRRKNPDPSQVVYRDRWQVAILPRKERDR